MTLIDQFLNFLHNIGLKTAETELPENLPVPGMMLTDGILLLDRQKIKYPGDLLYEGGVLACLPPEVRATISDPIPKTDFYISAEMMALAWSYAAAVHLGVDPAIVFHDYGYKGQSQQILTSFAEGRIIALPMLIWCGMCDPQSYPNMKQWLCDKRPE